MKKGIVMEIHRKYAILLSKNGCFEKGIILTEEAEVGDEVIFQPIFKTPIWEKYWRKSRITVRLSAIIVLVLLLFGYPLLKAGKNSETHAYVAIDINPSIELELNNDLVVTDINALNESADELMQEVNNLEDESVNTVLANIVNESENQGFADHKTMILGISSEEEENTEELTSQINPYLESIPDWEVSTVVIPEEIRELAQTQHKSMNETMALELANSDAELVNDNMTDSDDSAIIDFFYGEDESDSKLDYSTEQEKMLPKQQSNENINDAPDSDMEKENKQIQKEDTYQEEMDVNHLDKQPVKNEDNMLAQGLDMPSEVEIYEEIENSQHNDKKESEEDSPSFSKDENENNQEDYYKEEPIFQTEIKENWEEREVDWNQGEPEHPQEQETEDEKQSTEEVFV